MTLDAGEVEIRTVIAAALAQHSDAEGRGLDALAAIRQAEVVARALAQAGYEISGRNDRTTTPLPCALASRPDARRLCRPRR
jgi:hypothetical protein